MPADILDLLPEVMIYAPKCPEPLAVRFLRSAAREFCDRTRTWRETVSITLLSTEDEYVCQPYAELLEIEWANLNGYDLTPTTPLWLDKTMRGWQTNTEDAGSARYITQTTPNTVRVVPRATGALDMRLVLTPTRSADEIPSFLMDSYGEVLGKGAAGRILTTPSDEFANPQLGLALLSEFESALTRFAIKVAKGQQKTPMRTRASFF